MAAAEYVSVSSQRDTELDDLAQERAEFAHDPDGETRELAGVYRQRGLSEELANEAAAALMSKDALAAHVAPNMGWNRTRRARADRDRDPGTR